MDYLEIVSYERQSKYSIKIILKINRGNDELLFKVAHPYIPDDAKYFTCYIDNLVLDKEVYAVGENIKSISLRTAGLMTETTELLPT